MVLVFGLVLAATRDGFCRVNSMGFFLRSPLGLDVELLCVLGCQSLPAIELHGVGTDDAPNRLTGEEPLEDVEADVPARRAPGDEAAIDVVPEREARAARERLELPPQVAATPAVLEQPRRLGVLHGG